ncbi:O2R_65 [Salmonella enterica subsp. enterica serovar Paratyphi A]|nr:O2R_65 [Salmonella enterica subsp. enterica serovar Paratyphi A]
MWHPAGNEQGPAATTESACAKRRCALHPGVFLPGCQERRFGGDWQVRQQLPVGVGPDDRMPPGSREPKVRPADRTTLQ